MHICCESGGESCDLFISPQISCAEIRTIFILPSMAGKNGVLHELQRIKKTISRVENFYAEMLDISNNNCPANKLQNIHVSNLTNEYVFVLTWVI